MREINLKIVGDDDYFVQEALKVLRTNIQFCGKDKKVIAVTSCHENEGKSTVALGMARSLAEQNKSVLVIDADMRKSVMASRNANVRNAKGLSEVLTGMANVGECICKTQYPSLHILLSGKFPPNPVELLSREYFSALIEKAEKAYEYVIIDTPPVGEVIDAAVVAAVCDGTILVLGGRNARLRQAQSAIEQLTKSGKPVLGAVWNDHRQKNKKYYYQKQPYGRKS